MAHVIRIADAPVFARGGGVETTLLVGAEQCQGAGFTSGLTRFPAGAKVPFHSHNCDEQVTELEGEALATESRHDIRDHPDLERGRLLGRRHTRSGYLWQSAARSHMIPS